MTSSRVPSSPMPILIVAVILLAVLALFVVSIPVSLVLRYRTGKARRLARGWVVVTNLVLLVLSIALFFGGVAVTSLWVPRAPGYSLAGFAVGCALGVLGLALTRWEPTPRGLFFTPNRWLVLFLTLVVTARIAYGLWRTWHVWSSGLHTGDVAWLDEFGLAQSMMAGAVVLGHYLVYVLGLRGRLRGTTAPG